MASCAFFSFAAETIFIALVICIVDEIEVILPLISFKFAIFSLVVGCRLLVASLRKFRQLSTKNHQLILVIFRS